jgi:hypothetical protein
VHATFFGTGANGVFSFANCRHADARWGSVPPTGAHRTVKVRLGVWSWPFGQIVIWSDVAASTIAAKTLTGQG